MHAPHSLINPKFVFALPLRSDKHLIPVLHKTVGQIGYHPLRAALFQAV